MLNASRIFYQFLGVNSFLIGLFPFFIPVYLWKIDYDLATISFYIALTALGFTLSLWTWDRIHKTISLFNLFAISFALEILMMSAVFISPSTIFIVIFGISNGVYSCYFWTTQRAIFFETIDQSSSGRKYGNFQIFVSIVLQAGILVGGIVLEKYGYVLVYMISIIVCILALLFFHRSQLKLPSSLLCSKVLSISDIFKFNDQYNSRFIFCLDGLFLFLESYYWVISLFIIAHESFISLGIMVILLAVIFFILFLMLKNSIDKLNKKILFIIATLLYALSWVLRSQVSEDLQLLSLFLMLVVITFCTSLFRLTFNKRFYDLAKITNQHHYLILKSYYSQFFMILFYIGLGIYLSSTAPVSSSLNTIYLVAGLLSLCYLFYLKKPISR